MAYHSLLRKVITLQRKTKLIPPNSAISCGFLWGHRFIFFSGSPAKVKRAFKKSNA
jgi:hypothetical protein